MAQAVHAAGVDVGKAWNYAPDPDQAPRVATANDPRGYVEWDYHVAPTVPVVGKDGKTRPMVIDPSIATTPITPAQWTALQIQPESSLVLTTAKACCRAEDGGRGDTGTTPRCRPSSISTAWTGRPTFRC